MTRRVGRRLPIELAGMPLTSVPALVAAVRDAGGLGMLGGARYEAGWRRTLRPAPAARTGRSG